MCQCEPAGQLSTAVLWQDVSITSKSFGQMFLRAIWVITFEEQKDKNDKKTAIALSESGQGTHHASWLADINLSKTTSLYSPCCSVAG